MKKLAVVCIALCAGAIALTISPAKSAGKNEKFVRSTESIPNRYIIVLNDAPGPALEIEVGDMASELALEYRGTVDRVFTAALKGYSAEMSEADALSLSDDPRVKFVEEDAEVSLSQTQSGATWNLDRIDQHFLPLDTTYNYQQSGSRAHVYVLDTGIRTTHVEFGGRAQKNFDSVGDGQAGNDCHGHGTHVAGIIGGANYGVAKQTNLHAVRVLNCTGSGTTSGVVAGIDWVTANAIRPAVANMSLGGGISAALDTAVENSIAAGITYAVAAGNANLDACTSSPARAVNALTVAASDQNDQRAFFSNFGTCVDIFAPGMSIASAWFSTDSSLAMMSGTSMASPHVAAVAAQYLSSNPTASPATVRNYLVNAATNNILGTIGAGSPNQLIYAAVAPSQCTGANFQGSILTTGTSDFQSSVSGFAGRTGQYDADFTGPANSLFRLNLEVKKGQRWNVVAATDSSGSNASVSYRGKSGTYRWRIESISGAGSYGLCSMTP